ncbi:hypothetical protein C7967_11537 [Thalassospira sp. 11-3]|nr:hypothetical protein C7967_11537 [Thalassospira sp. 11-3]
MAKFKILVIAHLLANNEVANHGEIVDGSKLVGNPDDLVKKGFVELVKGSDKEDDKGETVKLDRLTKEKLVEYAAENLQLTLTVEGNTKAELIKAIEDAQKAKDQETEGGNE